MRREFEVADETIQSMFTSERLAHIEQSLEQVDSGEYLTAEQLITHFKTKDNDWLKRNGI
ncbi:MAG: hypothetical protein WCG75_11985 [Armatimonadota bacterium]